MITKTADKKQGKMLEILLEEVGVIKSHLEKLLLFIPEESVDEYKNPSRIKKSYSRALKTFPPK